jgi:hypothetical protein
MQPQRETKLFEEFLDKAVGESRFVNGILSICDPSDSLVRYLHRYARNVV